MGDVRFCVRSSKPSSSMNSNSPTSMLAPSSSSRASISTSSHPPLGLREVLDIINGLVSPRLPGEEERDGTTVKEERLDEDPVILGDSREASACGEFKLWERGVSRLTVGRSLTTPAGICDWPSSSFDSSSATVTMRERFGFLCFRERFDLVFDRCFSFFNRVVADMIYKWMVDFYKCE